mmetsp:Transcript_112173/g.298124  ORF Transcript_112173/g.298124 Transcript_112173/m.298124 type:complete len:201 (+) Transcript_112173:1307-1909(+)
MKKSRVEISARPSSRMIVRFLAKASCLGKFSCWKIGLSYLSSAIHSGVFSSCGTSSRIRSNQLRSIRHRRAHTGGRRLLGWLSRWPLTVSWSCRLCPRASATKARGTLTDSATTLLLMPSPLPDPFLWPPSATLLQLRTSMSLLGPSWRLPPRLATVRLGPEAFSPSSGPRGISSMLPFVFMTKERSITTLRGSTGSGPA